MEATCSQASLDMSERCTLAVIGYETTGARRIFQSLPHLLFGQDTAGSESAQTCGRGKQCTSAFALAASIERDEFPSECGGAVS